MPLLDETAAQKAFDDQLGKYVFLAHDGPQTHEMMLHLTGNRDSEEELVIAGDEAPIQAFWQALRSGRVGFMYRRLKGKDHARPAESP